MGDVQKSRRYRCPECSSPVIWSLSNGRPGATAKIICANNMKASRIDWKPSSDSLCTWNGLVIRQRDGSVRLFHSDGFMRLRDTKGRV